MTKKSASKSPFKTGLDAISERSSGTSKFMSIEADSAVTIAPLTGTEDMLSAEMHEFWDINPFVSMPCLGKDCPSCKLGNKSKFKAFLQVVTQDKSVKIFPFGISVARQIEELDEALDSVKGQVIRIKRNGSGLKTRYVVTALGKKIDVDEIEGFDLEVELGPIALEDQIQMLVDRGLAAESDFAEKKPMKKEPAKAKESDAFEEDDDDDPFGGL